MGDSGLLEDVFNRVLGDPDVEDKVKDVILAAMDGDIESALDGTSARPQPPAGQPAATTRRTYIKSILVGGFRGIGAPCMLELPAGPGLTLVIGRNGSGKSSFAEALELLVTGDNRRWSDRPTGWRDGWRNLHYPAARIAAEFLEDGVALPLKIERSWKDADPLDASQALCGRGGSTTMAAVGELGWNDAITNYRPFLSYNELGAMMEEGPSKLHDALAIVLGVEPVLAAAERLAVVRKARETAKDDAKAALAILTQLLKDCADPRATELLGSLHGRKPDLDRVRVAVGTMEGGDGSVEKERIAAFLRIRVPTASDVEATVVALELALAAAAAGSGTDTEQAHRLKDVLEAALAAHVHRGSDDCPVCGTAATFAGDWRARAVAEVKTLTDRAAEAQEVRQQVKRAEEALRSLAQLRSPALVGSEAALADLRPALLAWQEVSRAPVSQWPTLIRARHATLSAAVDALHGEAGEKLKLMDNTWRPICEAAINWITREERSRTNEIAVKQLKESEGWLKATAQQIRNERFTPIQEQVKVIWNMLRQQSSVELSEVAFEGKAKNRKVTLGVTVDGVKGAAIGVMSQGELHSLALSLFLPRATLPASPFGFIVVDDPVQAMDPAKVDGLARVLNSFAAKRQAVVFTHDDRLPEAVRRLGIKATVLEVQRGNSSAVSVRKGMAPQQQYLDDAFALVKTEGLPPKVLSQCLPGLCRSALEAVCVEVFRRRRLRIGMPHAAVEELLTAQKKLLPKVALVLMDDPAKAGDVMKTVASKYGGNAAAILKACNKGAHEGLEGLEPLTFAREAEKLVKSLAAET